MPIYSGNSKSKDLYYGGTKIKEAYYGNTKVYSSKKTETVIVPVTQYAILGTAMIPSGFVSGKTYNIKIESVSVNNYDGSTYLNLHDNTGSIVYRFVNSGTIRNYVGTVFSYTAQEDISLNFQEQKYGGFSLTSSNTGFNGSVTLEISWS